jgi:hypothetical protein
MVCGVSGVGGEGGVGGAWRCGMADSLCENVAGDAA